jgi:hypothetical protein
MANAWLTLVKKTWDDGRKTNKDYSYKQAMMDAKMKKNGSKKHSSKKGGQDGDVMEYGNEPDVSTPRAMGGKSRRRKKGGQDGDDDAMDISTTTPMDDDAMDVSTTTPMDDDDAMDVSTTTTPTMGGKSRRKKGKKGGKTSKKSKKGGKKSKKTRKSRK